MQFDYSLTVGTTYKFTPSDPSQKSSRNIPRKGKTTSNGLRDQFRLRFWFPVRERLKQRLQTHGEAAKIARFTGVHPAQIHRYTCPMCEHDQEPTYSVVCAIELYLNTHTHTHHETTHPPHRSHRPNHHSHRL